MNTPGGTGLDRFLKAQEGVYDRAHAELRAGTKRTHWMWFVFPQLAGLGRSDMARFFAIADLAEAKAYLEHPLLGPRLIECCNALMGWAGERDAVTILAPIDAMKLQSSMTLFERAATDTGPFAAILDAFYRGERDPRTLQLLT
ncbi:DUF1810 domain-containing protein [Croceicoccus bisphenolivorans]|uniref:DUF1810 domain-containing protein n=1 Tax=Croceicoccus bisphenolivorans TaxID=1783232 RepID=UPI000835124D|nr:DUF1810 domain-containing protein [Croceicoccus bisphenolivorans]